MGTQENSLSYDSTTGAEAACRTSYYFPKLCINTTFTLSFIERIEQTLKPVARVQSSAEVKEPQFPTYNL